MKADRYAVYTITPDGEVWWFMAPNEGATTVKEEAHLWRFEDLIRHIEACRAEGGDWGQKRGDMLDCRIRQVWADA